MQTIDIAAIEALIREGLPRATEEEVAGLVSHCAGRTMHPDNADLVRPFGPRDRERTRRERVETLVGCLLTGQRNGWFSNALNPQVRRVIEDAGVRAA
ncbi:hypothetical protein [Methylorubrum extorquens]|uniref:Uncharacterized protein n=1 Tax=Methylorubrum extorquens (strain CM4 / NCIMB 13688) TaxID=440085 RepID=B7KVZ0_METC4|nr:hypothetical protein [Methylorubrum extorquens]ACK82806.1 conserved hypothetical protein [Methylorubrum extorquens CM4]